MVRPASGEARFGTRASMISVLVVEDEPLTRRALKLALTAADFEVAEAGDAGSCREVINSRHIDVVVLDLGLPDVEGLAAIRRARAAAPGIPLVVLTGMDD